MGMTRLHYIPRLSAEAKVSHANKTQRLHRTAIIHTQCGFYSFVRQEQIRRIDFFIKEDVNRCLLTKELAQFIDNLVHLCQALNAQERHNMKEREACKMSHE